MLQAAAEVTVRESVDSFVSGGAAWADHVAIKMGHQLQYPTSIWLPEKERDIQTAEYYHSEFSRIVKYDTWKEMQKMSNLDYFKMYAHGGFKDRNTKVAEEADLFLAMTFGEKRQVKQGGTKDTVDKMNKMGKSGYHLDLNTLRLYKLFS